MSPYRTNIFDLLLLRAKWTFNIVPLPNLELANHKSLNSWIWIIADIQNYWVQTVRFSETLSVGTTNSFSGPETGSVVYLHSFVNWERASNLVPNLISRSKFEISKVPIWQRGDSQEQLCGGKITVVVCVWGQAVQGVSVLFLGST